MPDSPSATSQPQRRLSLFDSTCIIAGIIIGSGIYELTPAIAANSPTPFAFLGLWLAGGLFALIGSLCYAELATTFPADGGDYVYLTRAYGRRVGFLFAWSELWIVRPGNIGFLAFVFARYAGELLSASVAGEGPWLKVGLAGGAVIVLTGANLLGVRVGKLAQNVLTVAKVGGLVLVVAAGLVVFMMGPSSDDGGASAAPPAASKSPHHETRHRQDNVGSPRPPMLANHDTQHEARHAESRAAEEATPAKHSSGGYSLTLALIFVLFCYGGWSDMSYVAAEVKAPERNLLRALLLGSAAVTVVYLLLNVSFLAALGLSGAAQSEAIAAEVAEQAVGSWGGKAVSLLICISCLGAIHGMIFTGSRVYYAMGCEHRGFGWLGQWSGRFETPWSALLAQAAIAVALIVIFGDGQRGLEQLVVFTTPVFWIFFMLVAASVIVLRFRQPGRRRPFRVTWYPLPPVLFVLTCAFMLYQTLAYAYSQRSSEVWWSLVLLAIGAAASVFSLWKAGPQSPGKKL